MLLLYIYLASLIIGGILLGASLFLGSHHSDVDTDVDTDMDAGTDMDSHAELGSAEADAPAETTIAADSHGPDISDFWLPFISIRFWVFFLCFFGLTGFVLTLLQLLTDGLTLVTALSMGTVTGFAAAYIIQQLKKVEVGSGVTEQDYIGKEGIVLLPLTANGKGKIRIELHGQQVDLIARNDSDQQVDRGTRVLVIEIQQNMAIIEPLPSTDH